MTIRQLKDNEVEMALALTWRVFLKFEASEYSKEGVYEFYRSIHSQSYVKALSVYGAFQEEKLVGMIATRNEGRHIALFFVDERYHKQGIGRKLFEFACKDNSNHEITVNASPYAIPIYEHLGFAKTGKEQKTRGVRYTPMAYTQKPAD